MFNNAGAKIKVIAQVFFWILVIASGISLIVSFVVAHGNAAIIGIGFGIAIGGFLTAWISSLFLYGFGELIESCETAKNNSEISKNATINSEQCLRDIRADINKLSKTKLGGSSQNELLKKDELPPM